MGMPKSASGGKEGESLTATRSAVAEDPAAGRLEGAEVLWAGRLRAGQADRPKGGWAVATAVVGGVARMVVLRGFNK